MVAPHRSRRAHQRSMIRSFSSPLEAIPTQQKSKGWSRWRRAKKGADVRVDVANDMDGSDTKKGILPDEKQHNVTDEMSRGGPRSPLQDETEYGVVEGPESAVEEKKRAEGPDADSAIKSEIPLEDAPVVKHLTTSSSLYLTSGVDSSVYHIYHTGKMAESFSVHKVKDKEMPLPQVDDPHAPNYVDAPELREWKPTRTQQFCGLFSCSRRRNPVGSTMRRVKHWHCCDNPKYDPRTQTAPYFVHKPILWFHLPPYCMRRGGNKTSPPICLFRGSWFWRYYDLQFSEQLGTPGVMDPRGVVRESYGVSKKEPDRLRGYRLRSFRYWGETGKQYVQAEKKRRKQGKTGPKNAIETTSDEITSSSPLPLGPIKPDMVVRLSWMSPFRSPRKYHFTYAGIEFYWKGTATVKDAKLAGVFLAFNHLKLMAVVPAIPASESDDSPTKEDDEPEMKREICLAKYTSLVAGRKSGRLEIFDQKLREFTDKYVFHKSTSTLTGEQEVDEKLESNEDLAAQQLLQDVIFATAMCMIISEESKRDVISEMFWQIVDGASNA